MLRKGKVDQATRVSGARWLLSLGLLLMVFFPLGVSAHAIPVSTYPESSAALEEVPEEITIRFSERIDHKASAVTIAGPSETRREEAVIDPDDPRRVLVPLSDQGEGTYVVSWSVVSSDDGHFTKGTYAFTVGAGIATASVPISQVVAIKTAPEVLGMTVELFGHGLFWAVLFLIIFAVRPNRERIATEMPRLVTLFTYILILAIVLVVSGGLAQLVIKGGQLAVLQEIPSADGWLVYINTTSGLATAVRLIMALIVGTALILGRKRVFDSVRFTWIEGLSLAGLAAFALSRAVVSHATANPFLPPLSIGFNFLHVIEKDLWAGLLFILLLLSVYRGYRTIFGALAPKVYAMLNINLAFISISAVYIAWLHLKHFDNLFSTTWGVVFIQLLIVAALLVIIRVYHVVTASTRFLPFTLGAELAASLLVVYFSSAIIITSPPLLEPATPVYTAEDQGVTLTLSRYVHEDGMLLLTTTGDKEPKVVLSVEGGTSNLSIKLDQRFDGGYVFPEGLLPEDDEMVRLIITAPQSGGYDAHASFEFEPNVFTPEEGWESKRPLDGFTMTMVLIAILSAAAVYALHRFSSRVVRVSYDPGRFPVIQASLGFMVLLLIVTPLVFAYGSSRLAYPFKYDCVEDGNMWHLMQPMKSGVAVSSVSMEGCMWGMGQYFYMFSDSREYDLYRSLPPATVNLDHEPFVAGQPATFTVSVEEPDGSPATLFIDMEKLVHVVIVSEDQTVFAHIHPDESHPSYEEAVAQSSFTLEHTFPKSGRYMISVDYAHGVTLESEQFVVEVAGTREQEERPATYASPGSFGGYDVSFTYPQLMAGELALLQYVITKDGEPVTDMVPYLSAAMHLSIVKNDFTEFLHVHGEYHPPGQPIPPIIIKNGKVVHTMENMFTPPTFGPNVEAHLIFPTAGMYTVWGEFKVGDEVIPTSFTVRVE